MTLVAASTMVWVFILVPLIIVWVIGVVDIVRRPLPFQSKAAWILIVLILPVVGTIGYFLMRKPTKEEIRLGAAASADLPRDRRGEGFHPHQ